MSRAGPGAGARLAREIVARLGAEAELEALASRSWSSITFSGERHELRVRLGGNRAESTADGFRAEAGELELDVPGHLLVDLEVVRASRDPDGTMRLELRAVTLEAG